MAARYDTLDEEDVGDVYSKLSTLRQPFTKEDPKFWFNNFERTIKHFGVKRQVTKYEALINQLTKAAIKKNHLTAFQTKDQHGYVHRKQSAVEGCNTKLTNNWINSKG